MQKNSIDFIDRKISGRLNIVRFLNKELLGGQKMSINFWSKVDRSIGKSRLDLFVDAGLIIDVVGCLVMETGKFYDTLENDPDLFKIFNVTMTRTGVIAKEKPFLNESGRLLIDKWAHDFMARVDDAIILDVADTATALNELGEILHVLTEDARMIDSRYHKKKKETTAKS